MHILLLIWLLTDRLRKCVGLIRFIEGGAKPDVIYIDDKGIYSYNFRLG